MTAQQLVPGISRFPELENQLNQRIDMVSGGSKCSGCASAKLAREYRRKLQDRVERDKLQRKR